MKRVLVAVVLMVVLALQGVKPVDAADWSQVVARLQASTVAIACSLHNQNTCTAFSINEDQGLYMTAAHCVPASYAEVVEGQPLDEPRIDGQPVTVVFLSQSLDLAIVKATVKRPALYPRAESLVVGNEVGSYGYGYGGPTPIFRAGNVSGYFTDPNTAAEWLMFDNAVVGGMSGGPIVDWDGFVVGVNSKSDGMSGISLSIRQILAATQFWSK